jgi:peptidoglycan/xylan/chitin deacetylase (PgdA/CDA1 family)
VEDGASVKMALHETGKPRSPQPTMTEPNQIVQLLQRAEEAGAACDSIGNFETQHCARRWDASLYRPVADQMLHAAFPQWREGISWPEGKRFAACLSHDVDMVQIDSRYELARTIALNFRHAQGAGKKLKHLASAVGLRKTPREFDVFSPWVEAEQRLGFRSSFFFFPTHVRERHVIDNVYRWDDRTTYRGETCSVREIARDLHRRGWDVGLHGSYLSPLSYEMLAEQKEDIEKAIGETVITSRQHNLHFDAARTPALLERAGLKVDSTLGSNRDIGFRAGTSYPFRMWDAAARDWLKLVEIPLVLHDGALLRPDNLDLDLESAFALCRTIIDRVVETRGVVTLLWHPDKAALPDWFTLYTRLLEYISQQNGWGASARQIHEWWESSGLAAKHHHMVGKLAEGAR